MKVKRLVKEAEKELVEEKKELAKSVIKERIKEIKLAKKTLAKLEAQYNGLLNKDIDDVVEDLGEY